MTLQWQYINLHPITSHLKSTCFINKYIAMLPTCVRWCRASRVFSRVMVYSSFCVKLTMRMRTGLDLVSDVTRRQTPPTHGIYMGSPCWTPTSVGSAGYSKPWLQIKQINICKCLVQMSWGSGWELQDVPLMCWHSFVLTREANMLVWKPFSASPAKWTYEEVARLWT